MRGLQQTFALLDAHETQLLPLLQGSPTAPSGPDNHENLTGEQERALHLWLRAAQNAPPNEANEPDNLPLVQAMRWRGWVAYFQGDYGAACEQFLAGLKQLAQQDSTTNSPLLKGRLALGLAKVYTRTGHWQSARGWLLHALDQARRANSLLDMVKGYGALGELLLRGGHPRDALFCLGTARELLPAGAAERARQWNYLASALMRLNTARDQLAAESLLMSSYYLAMDSKDRTSANHALARLQFLELDRQQSRDMPTVIGHPATELEQTCPESAKDGVPEGFLAMGRAFAAWRRGEHSRATHLAEQASRCLRHTQAEQRWALALHQELHGVAVPGASVADLAIPVLEAPTHQSVLDSQWMRPRLTDAGALHFAPPSDGLDTLLNHRKVFFL